MKAQCDFGLDQEMDDTVLGLDLSSAVIRSRSSAGLGLSLDSSARLLLESMGCGVLAVDASGQIMGANPAATRLLNSSESDLLMQKVGELLDDRSGDLLDTIQATLGDGRERLAEAVQLICPDGARVHADVHCTAMTVVDGQPAWAVLCLADLSHRWRTDLVRATESRVLGLVAGGASLQHILTEITAGLERLFPGSMAAAVVLDERLEGLYVMAGENIPSDLTEAFEGHRPSEHSHSAALAVHRATAVVAVDVDAAPEWQAHLDLAHACGIRACWSLPILGDSGSALGSIALFFTEPREAAAGEFASVAFLAPLAAIAVERDRRNLALRTSQERLTSVVDAAVEAFRDWDLESDSIWWNRRPDSEFDFPEDDARTGSETWLRLVHPEDRDGVRDGVLRAVEAGQPLWEARYRVLRGDGSWGHVLDRAVLLRGASGRISRLIGGILDITNQIRIEEQLHQIQRLESIGQLSGGIAHDFNNLLTVILGNAEVLTELAAGDPALHTLAGTICKAAERGADLTQRLLAFGRRQALAPCAIDLDQRVQEQLPMLRRLLGESIEIQFHSDAGAHTAMVDPTQLDNALLNLCINARDAMPSGGRLDIRLGEELVEETESEDNESIPSGRYVALSVSDTGTGISQEALAHVFEPFFTTKEVGKGTGLGLPMVYGFVRQSGGQVRLQSAAGEGTCVTLILPPGPGREAARDAGTTPPRQPVGHGRILMVEDDPMVREFSAEQLRSLGFDVLVSTHGEEALGMLRSGVKVDLLFTDVVMPGGMSGVELVAAARRLRPGLPALLVSGYAEPLLGENGGPAIDLPLLGKPYRRAELAEQLRLALASTHPTAPDKTS